MFLKCLQVGPLMANCYILGDNAEKKAAIIDPGGNADQILDIIKKEGFQVDKIILTHGHADHISGLAEVKKATGAEIAIHQDDAALISDSQGNLSNYLGVKFDKLSADIELKDGDKLKIGNLVLEIIHAPGHTPGSICIKVGDIIFTGDTLFAGSIGRSDFPGGSYEALMSSIREKLLVYNDDTVIYPGHGVKTTLGQEKATNPFLR